MKVVQLKALCKERGLKVSGKKAELQERLKEHFVHQTKSVASVDEFADMTDDELRNVLKGRGINLKGSRMEMLDVLRKDIQMTLDLTETVAPVDRDSCEALSKVLEEAARKEGGVLSEYLEEFRQKSEEQPKHVEVRVTSLGVLEPEAYTSGGSPSVTAAVLVSQLPASDSFSIQTSLTFCVLYQRTLAGDPFSDPPRFGSVSR